MRKQIAAANWKMNLTYKDAETLLQEFVGKGVRFNENQKVVFAVPAPYLHLAVSKLAGEEHMFAAAQNCYSKTSGAYTGEISVEMLKSLDVEYVVIGHSERRSYFNESNQLLADKVSIALDSQITPIFCCGEDLPVRESGEQNKYVSTQLRESLYHLTAEQVQKVVIAYEPVWAIGTGKTATSAQAQEMHVNIRNQLAAQYGGAAENISILYGGSVKASNAKELFSQPDVDGGLVGGASLIASEFLAIMKALK